MESTRTSKWIAAVASIWIQSSCGASYAFGIYSPLLKSTQGYDQSTLDSVSVFKDIGANAGILSGLLYAAMMAGGRHRDHQHRPGSLLPRRGPWVVHVAGAIQCFVGYFFMWLSVTGRIPKPHVSFMCLFMFLAAHAQTFFNTANVVTSVQNFPEYGGTIVGIMKGFLGLSGAVLIQVYHMLFKSNPRTFLLMLALLPSLLTLVLMFLVKVNQTQTKDEKKHLNGFSLVALAVATYLVLLIVLENIIILSSWTRSIMFLVLIVLLASPITVAVRAHREDSIEISEKFSFSSAPLLDDPESAKPGRKAEQESPDAEPESVQHEAGDALQMNIIEAMQTLNFWLLFVAMLCGMGSGLATINNISQLGESLGYKAVETSTLVSLWSIWNFLGRFGAGYMSDVFLHRKGWGRPLIMSLTLAAMTAGHIVIASGFTGNLYVGSVLIGICYGSQWSLMPTITSEIFGVLHMGTIFNTIAVASPVGSYLFSVRVVGYIYDKEAAGKVNSCYGSHCFMLSFFIMASASLVGFLVSLVLFFRTRNFYSQVLVRRLRLKASR